MHRLETRLETTYACTSYVYHVVHQTGKMHRFSVCDFRLWHWRAPLLTISGENWSEISFISLWRMARETWESAYCTFPLSLSLSLSLYFFLLFYKHKWKINKGLWISQMNSTPSIRCKYMQRIWLNFKIIFFLFLHCILLVTRVKIFPRKYDSFLEISFSINRHCVPTATLWFWTRGRLCVNS